MSDAAPQWALAMSRDIGEIKGTLNSLAVSFDKHVAIDAAVEQRVDELEKGRAAQRGATKVLATIGTTLGAVGGALGGAMVNWWLRHR